MTRRTTVVACVLLLWVGLAAVAEPGGDGVAENTGLQVERLLWSPGPNGAGLLELRYRLVGVEELPKHPSVTYVLDPHNGHRVSLRRPAMLPPSPVEANHPAASVLDKYAGEYEFPKWKLKATVRRQGDQLYIDLPKSSEKEARPVAENQFLYPLKGYGDVRLEFTADSPAEINQMVAYFGYANIPFKKRGEVK